MVTFWHFTTYSFLTLSLSLRIALLGLDILLSMLTGSCVEHERSYYSIHRGFVASFSWSEIVSSEEKEKVQYP